MAHYYAFCEKHKKIGPNRDANDPDAREKAWGDCLKHRQQVGGSHGEVYVKLSTRTISPSGKKRYNYKSFFQP